MMVTIRKKKIKRNVSEAFKEQFNVTPINPEGKQRLNKVKDFVSNAGKTAKGVLKKLNKYLKDRSKKKRR